MLPVLVIGPWTLERPEENSEGTRPTKEPIVLPVNRSQSPISTAKREPRQRGDSPQATQAAHDRGELAVGGHHADRLIEAGSRRALIDTTVS